MSNYPYILEFGRQKKANSKSSLAAGGSRDRITHGNDVSAAEHRNHFRLGHDEVSMPTSN